jgi:phage terminase small subunit
MPILTNARHERFAQSVAFGIPSHAAYIEAGYREHHDNPYRLRENEGVKARIMEIQADTAKRVNLSRADLLQMMIEDRELARSQGQSAAAIRASELLGRELAGLYIEKRQVDINDGLRGLSERELEERLATIMDECGESEIATRIRSGAPYEEWGADVIRITLKARCQATPLRIAAV